MRARAPILAEAAPFHGLCTTLFRPAPTLRCNYAQAAIHTRAACTAGVHRRYCRISLAPLFASGVVQFSLQPLVAASCAAAGTAQTPSRSSSVSIREVNGREVSRGGELERPARTLDTTGRHVAGQLHDILAGGIVGSDSARSPRATTGSNRLPPLLLPDSGEKKSAPRPQRPIGYKIAKMGFSRSIALATCVLVTSGQPSCCAASNATPGKRHVAATCTLLLAQAPIWRWVGTLAGVC